MSGDLKLSPRPPIPGSESPDHVFHETPPPWRQTILKPIDPPAVSSAKGKMAPSPKATSESGSLRGFEPEGSADVTPPFSESNSAHSSPAYLRWAENLHNLLSDPDGVELYKNYLKTENVGELLDFWFACEGLKRLPNDQGEKIFQLIKVINRKFLRSKAVPIHDDTRKSIQEKIAAKSNIDQNIFDSAQLEVEDRMTRTTYRNFLASEMYLNYIQAQQIGPESDFSPKHSDSHSTESSLSGRGLPMADDSGHFSGVQDTGEKSKSGQSTRPPTSLAPGESSTSDSTSGVSESSSSLHHPLPLPHPPPVPNTSLANASLNISSRDITREADISADESSMLASSHQQSQSHTALPTLHEDSELDMDAPSSTLPSLPASLLNSLTAQSLNFTAKKRYNPKPEAQAGIYLQGGRLPPHPYHAYNSAYNPVSRQDSELQSLSSDAQTTDDNASSFTESSSAYNSYRHITNKKYIKKHVKRMQEQSRQNREGQPGQHGNQAVPGTAFIPRTARVPTEASNQLPPSEFAAILTQKLEKLKKEQELNEKLTKKLAEDASSMVSQDSNRSLADILREKLIIPDDGDGDQSILDDHVSRVWTDKTPLRSPGDPSGRPRSPGLSRRGRGLAPRLAPPGGHSGVSHPHRTLPGRVPVRGGHPPPGPLRNVAAHPHPSGPVYHQDLAYYEIDSRGPNSRMMVPQQPMEGGQNNDRVMEWMLNVERSGGAGSHDQISQSSRGATKTSPRSKARHGLSSHGHRSVSQDRGQMSTSWSGHTPTPGTMHYQAQMDEEAKRRLGSSMAMPPPSQSNNSTLRKAPGGQARISQGGPPADITVAVYTFSHEKGEPMPYRVKIPARAVSLRHVKDYLPKKGAFRFYFKTEVDGDMCYEEETEDTSLVPLWEGKVLVQCRLLD